MADIVKVATESLSIAEQASAGTLDTLISERDKPRVFQRAGRPRVFSVDQRLR